MRIQMRAAARRVASAAVLLVFTSAVPGSALLSEARAQNGFPPPAQQSGHSQMPGLGDASSRDDAALSRSAQEKQAVLRNDERQKRLVADTDKLLSLATQLHEDVSKTNKNILSIDVVKRSQEIEKLAHDIKERMKG